MNTHNVGCRGILRALCAPRVQSRIHHGGHGGTRRRGAGDSSAWAIACVLCLLVSSASGQVTHGPPRVRNVYIPADELKLLFDSSSKGVLMPRDKILALWQEGRRHSSSQALAPADTVLTEATYEAQLADHELRVTGRMKAGRRSTCLLADWPSSQRSWTVNRRASGASRTEPCSCCLRRKAALS